MIAYIKDQIGAVIFFYSQIGIVMVIAELGSSLSGGEIGASTYGYMLLIVTFFQIVYHLYRYFRFRDIYRYAASDASETAWLPDTPDQLTTQLKEHYEKQYDYYKQELERFHHEKKQETLFMQQWIHQMKTPLSVMRLTIDKEETHLPPALKQNLDEELDRIKHGLQLALYQSRLQQFERDFHVEKIVLAELVRSIIQEYKSSFIRHRVYPKIDMDPSLTVYSDQKWLGFVLEQVTSNAIKYSQHSNDTILFRTRIENDQIVLAVQDHGIGIAKQDLTRVFDPFFTGENGRHVRESTGMGLYLAKQICDALDHKLLVQSVIQEWTTISVVFNEGR